MLNTASTTSVILKGFTQFSTAGFIILGLSMTLVVAIFVFRWGFWRLVNHTDMGKRLGHGKFVAWADGWSFRGSRQYKRMIDDM